MSPEEALIILGIVLALLAIAILRRLTKIAKRLTDVHAALLQISAKQSAATLADGINGRKSQPPPSRDH